MILKSAPNVALSNQAEAPQSNAIATQFALPTGGPTTEEVLRAPRRVPIIELNEHLTCYLCKGYYVDATTIIECLHSFCRSCIVKYLETNKYCPVCDVQVHKTKPLLNIRPDKTLQDVVYKLVPKLFQNEMQRRCAFYADHPDTKPSSLEQRGEASYQHLLTPDETICISLIYHGASEQATPRYLRCPAAVSVSHLQKLIRAKYDLNDNHRVDILHSQDCLNAYLTLMDVAYIYLWRRKGPLALTYRIYENTKSNKQQSKLSSNEKNNNETYEEGWKEVQLRISENGEMSVTGIQDCLNILEDNILKDNDKDEGNKEAEIDKAIVAITSSNEDKCKEMTTLKTKTKNEQSPTHTFGGNEDKGKQKLRSKRDENSGTSLLRETRSTLQLKNATNEATNNKKDAKMKGLKQGNVEKLDRKRKASADDAKTVEKSEISHKKVKTTKAIDASQHSTPISDKPVLLNHSAGLQNLSSNHPLKKHSLATTTTSPNRSPSSNKTVSEDYSGLSEISITKVKSTKQQSAPIPKSSPHSQQPKQVQQQKQLQLNKTSLMPPTTTATSSTQASGTATCTTSTTTPSSSIMQPAPPQALPLPTYPQHSNNKVYTPPHTPSYTPINVPVPTVQKLNNSVTSSNRATSNASPSPSAQAGKLKPTQSYKTLRDPPKTWNPQLPRPEPKTTNDLRNIRPAKFFKMRNNLPRYLGNPASGVKPMYQVHPTGSPEKDKDTKDKEKDKEKEKSNKKDSEGIKKSSNSSSTEIKRHSVVKIDPKTLKPIMERAPEMTSLSSTFNHHNQGAGTQKTSDLKINTSSVSIFNPLKLQQQSERKSPHSPNVGGNKSRTSSTPSPTPTNVSPSTSSPHLSANVSGLMSPGVSPSLKHPHQPQVQKPNLSFTPTNPFVPNLQSPTMSPNQFMYPQSGGFPSYDPMMMAAYQSFLAYRMPFNYDLHKLQQMGVYPMGGLMMNQNPKSPGQGQGSQQQHQQHLMLQNQQLDERSDRNDRRKSPSDMPPAKKAKVDLSKDIKDKSGETDDKTKASSVKTTIVQVAKEKECKTNSHAKITNLKSNNSLSTGKSITLMSSITITPSRTTMTAANETILSSISNNEPIKDVHVKTDQISLKNSEEQKEEMSATPTSPTITNDETIIKESKSQIQRESNELVVEPKEVIETTPSKNEGILEDSSKIEPELKENNKNEETSTTLTSSSDNLVVSPINVSGSLVTTVSGNKLTGKAEKSLQNALDKLTKAKMNESIPIVGNENSESNKISSDKPIESDGIGDKDDDNLESKIRESIEEKQSVVSTELPAEREKIENQIGNDSVSEDVSTKEKDLDDKTSKNIPMSTVAEADTAGQETLPATPQKQIANENENEQIAKATEILVEGNELKESIADIVEIVTSNPTNDGNADVADNANASGNDESYKINNTQPSDSSNTITIEPVKPVTVTVANDNDVETSDIANNDKV